MAVNVTSWEDFLTAASGNDPTLEINLPENAVWDLGEIEPEGHTGYIKLTGQINGNGTNIKNLVILDPSGTQSGVFQINGTVTDLHFADGVWASPTYVMNLTNNSIIQLCTLSASLQGGNNITLFYTAYQKATAYRCAANIEIATSDSITVHGNNIIGKYNNLKISGSHVSAAYLTQNPNLTGNGVAEYSSIALDTPALANIGGSTFYWSLLRCNGSNVSDLSGVGDRYGAKVTLACSNDFPGATQISSGLALCTEQQLHDASYLQSIGFPIGVET